MYRLFIKFLNFIYSKQVDYSSLENTIVRIVWLKGLLHLILNIASVTLIVFTYFCRKS